MAEIAVSETMTPANQLLSTENSTPVIKNDGTPTEQNFMSATNQS
jgi:hypothetical protein